MANADLLWDNLLQVWPLGQQWLTIIEIYNIIPINTCGITNRSSYDFAILTLLSTVRRPNYLLHDDLNTERVINEEVIKNNRNNGIWRQYFNSKVKKIENTMDIQNYENIEEHIFSKIDKVVTPINVNNLQKSSDYLDTVKRLIDQMNCELGWDKRLEGYKWRQRNFYETEKDISGWLKTGKDLSFLIIDNKNWSPKDNEKSVKWAKEIFAWGGTYQKQIVTAENIYKVLYNAMHNSDSMYPNAPLNSGYSKVCSFGTAFLESSDNKQLTSQVINDTRVSASLLSRIDNILFENRLPIDIFQGIGRIDVARTSNGTRPRRLRLNWPNGYTIWSSQFATTELVKCIRDILNSEDNKYPKMPIDEKGGVSFWTLRGVEAVLFMDGY